MAERKRNVVLHIGTGKTGTTSIQAYLQAARKELVRRGLYYPKTWGAKHHGHLVGVMDPTAKRFSHGKDASGAPAGDGAVIAAAFAEEIAALPPEVHTIVISSEMLYGHSLTPGGPERLRAFLEPHAASWRVIVYLRRQDERAVSGFSTWVKAGRTVEDPFSPGQKKLRGLDYEACLAPWAAAFGQAAMVVRIFDRAELLGGDVVRDFLEAAGIGALETPLPETPQNRSLSAPALEFMRRMNAAIEAERAKDEPKEGKERIVLRTGKPTVLRRILASRFTGRSLLPARARAEAFYAGFRESNARVAARYLSGRAQLFREDFSRYPESEAGPSAEAVLEVAETVVLTLLSEIEQHASEDLLRRARDAAAAGDKARAGQHYARAIAAGAGPTAYRELAALGLDRTELTRLKKIASAKLSGRDRKRLAQALAPAGPEGKRRRPRAAEAENSAARRDGDGGSEPRPRGKGRPDREARRAVRRQDGAGKAGREGREARRLTRGGAEA